MRKMSGVFGVIMLVMMLVSACSSSEEVYYESGMSKSASTDSVREEMKEEAPMDVDESQDYGGETSLSNGMNQTASEALSNRKIIKTADVYMETLSFDQSLEEIQVLMNKYGGYTARSQVEGSARDSEYSSRFANYTIKVPAENFEKMFAEVKEIGHVLNASDGIEDVTGAVTDIEARLATLKVQEERMLDILSKLDKLEDIVELEYALQDVRYEIESYESTLRNFEDQIRFSTITLRVQEVFEVTRISEKPLTLGERINEGLDETFTEIKDGTQNLLVFLITQFPYILFTLLMIFIVVFFARKSTKKNLGHAKVENSKEEEAIDQNNSKE